MNSSKDEDKVVTSTHVISEDTRQSSLFSLAFTYVKELFGDKTAKAMNPSTSDTQATNSSPNIIPSNISVYNASQILHDSLKPNTVNANQTLESSVTPSHAFNDSSQMNAKNSAEAPMSSKSFNQLHQSDNGTIDLSHRSNPFQHHHHVDMVPLQSPGHLNHATIFTLRPTVPVETQKRVEEGPEYPYQEVNDTYWCVLTRSTYTNNTSRSFLIPLAGSPFIFVVYLYNHFTFSYLNNSRFFLAVQHQWTQKNCSNLVTRADDEDTERERHYISKIAMLPKSNETRVISFGLYGNQPRYTIGAIQNMELKKTYFPDWVDPL
jgi:hypothetical protein